MYLKCGKVDNTRQTTEEFKKCSGVQVGNMFTSYSYLRYTKIKELWSHHILEIRIYNLNIHSKFIKEIVLD